MKRENESLSKASAAKDDWSTYMKKMSNRPNDSKGQSPAGDDEVRYTRTHMHQQRWIHVGRHIDGLADKPTDRHAHTHTTPNAQKKGAVSSNTTPPGNSAQMNGPSVGPGVRLRPGGQMVSGNMPPEAKGSCFA